MYDIHLAASTPGGYPAYFVGYVQEFPGPRGSTRAVAALTADENFDNVTPIRLGDGIPRGAPVVNDTAWVRNGDIGNFVIVGTSRDRVERHWVWLSSPNGLTGTSSFREFTPPPTLPRFERYDLIQAGGSTNKSGGLIIVGRGTSSRVVDSNTSCVVAWLPGTVGELIAVEPFVLDCDVNSSGTTGITHVAVSRLAADQNADWMIAWVKNGNICVKTISDGRGLSTDIPEDPLSTCGGFPVGSRRGITELVVDGGRSGFIDSSDRLRQRFVIAHAERAPTLPDSVQNLFVWVLNTGSLAGTTATRLPRDLGTTRGDLRLAQEAIRGAHFMLLDSTLTDGPIKRTRFTRLGHTGQIVQRHAIQSPLIWPFDHDLDFEIASDRFGVVRPLVAPTQGLYGRLVHHTNRDQVLYLDGGCDASNTVRLPDGERHPGTRSDTPSLTGHDSYLVKLESAPVGKRVTLTWSPQLLRGASGACNFVPDPTTAAETTPRYRPPAGSASTIVELDGTAVIAVRPFSLSDQAGGLFPGSSNTLPPDLLLNFQWSWVDIDAVVVPGDAIPPDVDIRVVTRRSNTVRVVFNP